MTIRLCSRDLVPKFNSKPRDEIHEMRALERVPFVRDLNRTFGLERNAAQLELNRKRVAVETFKQASMQLAVYFHCRADDLKRLRIRRGGDHVGQQSKRAAAELHQRLTHKSLESPRLSF